MNRQLQELIERLGDWPEDAQNLLVEFGLEIEASRKEGYVPSAGEKTAIENGLADLEQGRIGPDAEVAEAFAKFRRG